MEKLKKILLQRLLYIAIIIGVIFIFKKCNDLLIINSIKDKKIYVIHNYLFDDNEKIIIFQGTKKIDEFPANNATSLLSVENDKLYYLETNEEKQENFVIQVNLKTKKVINRLKIPFETSVYYAKKINNKIYFSNYSNQETNVFFDGEYFRTQILYEFDIEKNKITKILDYDTKGLPVISEKEIVYSKKNKIYLYDTETLESKYLVDGTYPFEKTENEIYYEENKKFMVKNMKTNNKKVLFEKRGDFEGIPKKITGNLYLVMKIDVDNVFPYFSYIKLELWDNFSKNKLNLKKELLKNEIKEQKEGLNHLLDTSILIY